MLKTQVGKRLPRCRPRFHEASMKRRRVINVAVRFLEDCPEATHFIMPCWVCDVAPHLPGWTFVTHKSTTQFNEWVVAELTTGFSVVDRESSQEEAKSVAREKLKSITPEQMQAAIDKVPFMREIEDAKRRAFLSSMGAAAAVEGTAPLSTQEAQAK